MNNDKDKREKGKKVKTFVKNTGITLESSKPVYHRTKGIPIVIRNKRTSGGDDDDRQSTYR